MMFQPINLIQVSYADGDKKQPVGRLAIQNRQIFFEYHTDFLATGLELSPMKLPLKSGVLSCDYSPFDGLFGVFNDSLPDGWGRLLLDRKLIGLGIQSGSLSPLDRLGYVGANGLGALIYEPEIEDRGHSTYSDLDTIANEVMQFQENNDAHFVDNLLALNGSSAGARPKILVDIDEVSWIIKFRSSLDFLDIGPIEYAYHLMAVEAGLEAPTATLFPAKKGAGYFGIQRFDRTQNKRIHAHSMSGLLHTDHRLPSLDYEVILKATLWLTKDIQECEKQFRAAVFNVVTYNRDDHAKNFSFLMDKSGVWKVSPAYDLTFSSGPSGEHCTTVMGEGKNPTISHLLKLAEVSGIKKEHAVAMIDKVRHAASKWPSFAKQAGVSRSSSALIQNSHLSER